MCTRLRSAYPAARLASLSRVFPDTVPLPSNGLPPPKAKVRRSACRNSSHKTVRPIFHKSNSSLHVLASILCLAHLPQLVAYYQRFQSYARLQQRRSSNEGYASANQKLVTRYEEYLTCKRIVIALFSDSMLRSIAQQVDEQFLGVSSRSL
jgi:hypothetical protein